MRNIRQNLFFALTYNIVGIPVPRYPAVTDHRCGGDGGRAARVDSLGCVGRVISVVFG
jgi:hypothetical protein